MKIFVAGATGVVGLPLERALCTLGHRVTGMTRAGPGVDRLRELGAAASGADAFDPKAVRDAIEAAEPAKPYALVAPNYPALIESYRKAQQVAGKQ